MKLICWLNLWVVAVPLAWGAEVDFVHDVAPVLKKHCVECHGGDKSEGGFSMNTRASLLDAEAAVPGKSGKSEMILRLRSDNPDEQMPPPKKDRLSGKEIAVLERWIDSGLEWEPGFSFSSGGYEPPLKPRRPELPPVVDGRENAVDRILDAYLKGEKLRFPTPVSDREFARRLYLDVIGLPPPPEELTAFLGKKGGERRGRLVKQVLSRDQAYAEHWMTFWNDLLRNAYSGTGFIDGGRKQITGWLYQSLMENKSFDQFTSQLISPTGDSEGFIRGIKWRGDVNASQSRALQFAQGVSQVFLGINMKCASCHDSFIDRWTLKEAYGLASIVSKKELELTRCDKPTGAKAAVGWIFPELGNVDPAADQPERLRQLAALMTHQDNGRFTRTIVNRLWRQLMGRGIVHPVDAMHTRPWSEDLLDYLACYLVDQKYDLKKVMELILTSDAYRGRGTKLTQRPDDYRFEGPLMRRMTAEQFLDAIWSITGTWPKPDSRAFKKDGRQQGGQLEAVLKAHGENAEWGDRPVRAVFTPLNGLQASLGRPNREQVVTERPDLMTTLEAIHLANGPTLAGTLAAAGTNLLEQWKGKPGEMIDWLFLSALSREPTRREREALTELTGAEPTRETVEDLLWAVFMLPEFQYVN